MSAFKVGDKVIICKPPDSLGGWISAINKYNGLVATVTVSETPSWGGVAYRLELAHETIPFWFIAEWLQPLDASESSPNNQEDPDSQLASSDGLEGPWSLL